MLTALLIGATLFAADSAPAVDSPRLTDAERIAIKELGATFTAEGHIRLGNVILDPKSREIFFDAFMKVTSRDILEVLIATPGGRIHEALVVADINPMHLQLLLYLAGHENGTRRNGTGQGARFRIEVTPDGGGRRPIEDWIQRVDTDRHIAPRDWVFVGSSFEGSDCLATREGNVVLLWSNGQSIFDNPDPDGDDDNNFFPYAPNLPPDADLKKPAVRVHFIPKDRVVRRTAKTDADARS